MKYKSWPVQQYIRKERHRQERVFNRIFCARHLPIWNFFVDASAAHARFCRQTCNVTTQSPHKTKCIPTILIVLISRSEEHTSELQSLMRISYAVFCLKK